MNESYEDIKSLTKRKPDWFDSNGVPRYAKFKPDMCPNIYAKEVLLLEIACQDCRQKFLVEYHDDSVFGRDEIAKRMRDWARRHRENRSEFIPVHYGDPPVHGCIGDTMNCDDIRIVEFWRQNDKTDWERVKKFEREFE